ncbi:MAG: CDP-alcohol phosphatidyltransferase family protein [Microcella sp.]|uniref:CDP-alcohol phosphatidyltransferase family protein n=1 Tax=Microcella sp. TaxID=1913979 RepID=UPI0024CADABE|nr:CDP-alcohol phosphatidyltransferase family protein [Microcella sp.]UYN84422.1 MAG: CDP-alcohol phosphatidyltransferase family protein [Microcella sp.]
MALAHSSTLPRGRRWRAMRAIGTPVRRFLVIASLGVPVVIGIGLWLFADAGLLAMIIGVIAFVGGTAGAAWQLTRRHSHSRLGLANVVTLLRLALVSALIIPLVGASPAPVAIIAIATISLSLDGVDGWLARRQGLSSDFGGSFDMEVDSVFALVLALLAVVVGGAPWFVLLLGLPRYLFWVAGALWPWLYDPLPSRYSGKVVAVVQMITLIVLQLPGLPFALATALTVGVLAALGWSFGRDIVWLWRRRG